MSEIDPGTLGWVKTEIDETLKQARLALESFAENNADNTNLRFCNTYLHQVLGTLQMVELDGAAMLARENEALAEAILNGKVEANSQHFETLIRGILTLPDYLSRLQYNQMDAPIRLLPVINDLRAARGAEPIAEFDLFAPDLTVRPPTVPGEQRVATEEDFVAAAKTLRPTFQMALLNWLRDTSKQEHLEKMFGVVSKLERQSHLSMVEQLFWVASGYLEALMSAGLEPSNERKKLLGRLDQQIKKLIDDSDKVLQRNSTEALVKAMLFEIGSIKSSEGKIGEIKTAFNLDTLLNSSSEEEDGQRYNLPTPEALQAVSTALRSEIEKAQEMLSAYFDPEQPDQTTLQPLLELLEKMAGALDMLGVDLLKALVDELMAVCRAISEKRLQKPEMASMPMASALLFIESSARDINKLGTGWKKQIEDAIAVLRRMHGGGDVPLEGIEITDATLTDSEFKQLLRVVAGEIRVNLSNAEEALEAFASSPADLTLLEPIQPYLSQIQGALQILGQEGVADLTSATNQYIQEMRNQGSAVNSTALDALAVCIGTIGAYIEGLERDRPNLNALLDAAWRDLDVARQGKGTTISDPAMLVEDMQKNLNLWLDDAHNKQAQGVLKQDLRDIASLASKISQEKIAKISNEMNSLLEIIAEDPEQLSDPIRATLKQSAATLASLCEQHLYGRVKVAPPPTPRPVEPKVSSGGRTVSKPASAQPDDDFDEEIMEIFIEDARDIMQTIERTLPVWADSPDNRDVLLELRRAFHTLKGSGRMVGASVIAELAWAVENMLNRVREDKIVHSDAMVGLLYEVQDALPLLVGHLEGAPDPQVDVEALQARADTLASGGEVATSPRPASRRPAAQVSSGTSARVAHEEEEEIETPPLDAALLQIFTGETRGHLTTIRDEVQQGRTSGASQVSEALLRAAHTLQGSSRALGLRPMAKCCAALEKLLHTIQVRQEPLPNSVLNLMETMAEVIDRLLGELIEGEVPADLLQEEFSSLAMAYSEEMARFPEHETESYEAAKRTTAAQAAKAPSFERTLFTSSTPSKRAAPAQEAEVHEEMDPELLEIFLEEAVDILAAIEEALAKWRNDRSDLNAVADLKRSLHTLKGGARMSGAMTMGNLGHNTESLLREVEDGRIEASADLLDLLDEVHDALVTMINQMHDRRPITNVAILNAKVLAMLNGETYVPPTEAEAKAYVQSSGAANQADDEEIAALMLPGAAQASTRSYTELQDDVPLARGAEAGIEPSDRREQIRVRASLLSNLVNYAGEVSIARSRMEQQIFGFRENLAELNRNVIRFREQIRELEIQSESQILYRAEQNISSASSEFDPLEFDRFSKLQHLSRGLAESLHDLFTIQSNMDNFVGQAETVLQQQARVNTDLQEGLMRTRMISFSTQAARLRHMVRQTARELGKKVELQLKGAEVEVDRTVLERMNGPFEHMIRNAIDHGIEDEATRRKAGKPPVGTITVHTSHEGSEVIIRLSDDGGGLDIEAIRRKAAERGLIQDGAVLSDEELMQFILVAGFSTASKITHLSGRGVGMDVVHNEIKQLGGSITVDTQRGKGTSFIVRLPLTLAITQALMVYVGEQIYAIPLSAVVNILEVSEKKLTSISMGKRPLLNHEDQVYPFMHLAARLGIAPLPRTVRKVPVLLVKSGSRQMAIQVDGLGSTREVVIKSVGPQLSEIEFISGATIMGDGRVILILDVSGLWMSDERLHVAAKAPVKSKAEEKSTRRPLVMVVDDSITVRKVTARYLQKNMIDVISAKDGIDAVEQLREQTPDVMLVDIEMPRMDGYELTTNVRADPSLRHIPIIMITSRAGAKHRERALQLGVNLYMTKPYQEDELLKSIHAMLDRDKAQ